MQLLSQQRALHPTAFATADAPDLLTGLPRFFQRGAAPARCNHVAGKRFHGAGQTPRCAAADAAALASPCLQGRARAGIEPQLDPVDPPALAAPATCQ